MKVTVVLWPPTVVHLNGIPTELLEPTKVVMDAANVPLAFESGEKRTALFGVVGDTTGRWCP